MLSISPRLTLYSLLPLPLVELLLGEEHAGGCQGDEEDLLHGDSVHG